MLEKVGDEDIIVRNYVDNFNIKEYIQEVLIPEAFPDIPMNKLNVGFTGVISEYMSQGIEDSVGTASLMLNESFITKAVLPESIYAEAAKYDLGYSFAVPSKCNFALQLYLEDVLNYSEAVSTSTVLRYKLDKDTQIILGDTIYKLDYDIFIDHQTINGRVVYNVYYNISGNNSISDITNKYIKYQVTSIGWIVLFLELKEFDRNSGSEDITDNSLTTNSDITLTWTDQIAGLDLTYVSPTGQEIAMKLKPQYTTADTEPFVWYRFIDDNTIKVSFTSNSRYWVPDFNSRIDYCIYTTHGSSANFTSYDRKTGVPVKACSDNYSYNEDTQMVAICYSGSTGGIDKGDIEDLRNKVILAANSINVLNTDADLDLWFETYGKRYGSISKFFKRRDDPTGRLWSQFVAIQDDTYVYPTNTLNLVVTSDQFDFVNNDSYGRNSEFIIKPGHIWEYDDTDDEPVCRNRVRMVEGVNGYAMISDETLPSITSTRQFMFVNPFYIKVHRDPMLMTSYNYLVDHTSWPESIALNEDCPYQFQMAQFSIQRTISNTNGNMYHIEAIVVPVVNDDVTYVEGIGDDYPVESNKLRLVLITRTKEDGETGYIEMIPSENRTGGSILFSTDIAVYDNISSDMMIEVDLDRTNMASLITSGKREGKVFMDSNETSFHFACMMKIDGSAESGIYGNETFNGYVMANRFQNAKRDLTLYKAMSMMRSMIEFSGVNDDYTINISLIPMLRYDIPLDDTKMTYFTQAFAEQYEAMEPIISKLDGNSYLDFKLYNTYGRSSNYYIGPEDGVDSLKDSTILLDNVYVNVKLIISVYDRSLYTQTVEEVQNRIITSFKELDANSNTDLYVSDLIHDIVNDIPNVRYLRFLGFNNYDANKQAIFVKYNDISELNEDQLKIRVPEMIRVDSSSITINEET